MKKNHRTLWHFGNNYLCCNYWSSILLRDNKKTRPTNSVERVPLESKSGSSFHQHIIVQFIS